ncbi:MAG: hypothetical protein ACLRFM_02770 [Alphaproteobacteria bacterium]
MALFAKNKLNKGIIELLNKIIQEPGVEIKPLSNSRIDNADDKRKVSYHNNNSYVVTKDGKEVFVIEKSHNSRFIDKENSRHNRDYYKLTINGKEQDFDTNKLKKLFEMVDKKHLDMSKNKTPKQQNATLAFLHRFVHE